MQKANHENTKYDRFGEESPYHSCLSLSLLNGILLVSTHLGIYKPPHITKKKKKKKNIHPTPIFKTEES